MILVKSVICLKVTIDSAQSGEERSELQGELALHQQKAAQGYQSLHSDSESMALCSSYGYIISASMNVTVDLLQCVCGMRLLEEGGLMKSYRAF